MKALVIALITLMLFSVNFANAVEVTNLDIHKNWFQYYNKPVKWSDTNLDVFIQTQDLMQREYVITALNNWQWYTNNTIRFHIVDRFGESDISIIVTNDLQTNLTCMVLDALGCIDYIASYPNKAGAKRADFSKIQRADIHIGTNACINWLDEDYIIHEKCKRIDELTFFKTVLHETGHAIGLGHNDLEYDIMNASVSNSTQLVTKHTVELIQQIYN